MREILFRGKRKDNGEWVHGYLREIWSSVNSDERFTICPAKGFANDGFTDIDEVEVIAGTVGQFTGLLDKKSVKVFEGDIVLYKEMKLVVRWDNDKAGFFVGKDRYWMMNDINLEVIGNVTDNKELLEVKE